MCYIKVPIKSSKTTYQCIYTHTHAISRFFINGLCQACWSLISFLQLIKCPHFLIPFTSFFKRLFLSMLSFFFKLFPVFLIVSHTVVNTLQCRVFHTCVVISWVKFLEGRLPEHRVYTFYIMICIAQIVSRNKTSTDYIFTNMARKCPWEPRLF